jgi:hypothetical protein
MFSSNSFLARILESDKAEYFGPSGRFGVCGFGVSISEWLISIFGSSTFSMFLISLLLIFSTIE